MTSFYLDYYLKFFESQTNGDILMADLEGPQSKRI